MSFVTIFNILKVRAYPEAETDLDPHRDGGVPHHVPHPAGQDGHGGGDVRLQVPGQAVRGVVHVLQYEPVHTAGQVDLSLLLHLLHDLLDGGGGARGAGQGWEVEHPHNVTVLVTE